MKLFWNQNLWLKVLLQPRFWKNPKITQKLQSKIPILSWPRVNWKASLKLLKRWQLSDRKLFSKLISNVKNRVSKFWRPGKRIEWIFWRTTSQYVTISSSSLTGRFWLHRSRWRKCKNILRKSKKLNRVIPNKWQKIRSSLLLASETSSQSQNKTKTNKSNSIRQYLGMQI